MFARKKLGGSGQKHSKAGSSHLPYSCSTGPYDPDINLQFYLWLIMILVYMYYKVIHYIRLPPPYTSFPLKWYIFFVISDVRLLMTMTIIHPREKYHLIHRMVYSLTTLQNVTYRSMGLCLSVIAGSTTRVFLRLLLYRR